MSTMSFWPWLAVAGAGALHGLNPATGWALVAAWRLRSRDGGGGGSDAPAWRATLSHTLWPLATGHALSIALVAGAVALGLPMQRAEVQAGAAALLVAMVVLMAGTAWRHRRTHGGAPHRVASRLPRAALALWSCAMSTAHGAGMMLVPALLPLCTSGPAREITASGSWPLALAAVALHAAAMLAVVAVLGALGASGVGASSGMETLARWARGESPTMQRCEPRNALRRPVSPPPISAPPSACSPPA